jgi:hypothetical protein
MTDPSELEEWAEWAAVEEWFKLSPAGPNGKLARAALRALCERVERETLAARESCARCGGSRWITVVETDGATTTAGNAPCPDCRVEAAR